MFGSDLHLTPAYGRDYKSKAAVVTAWEQGKDFRVAPSGQYCSKRDEDSIVGQIWIRYNNLRMVVRVK